MPGAPSSHPAADTLYSFSGKIEPTRVSPAYRAGLIVVAVAMLVLPVVYLGLIAAAAAAVWWHVTANTWIFDDSGGGLFRAIAYFGPAVAGIVLIFFMIKPILARPAKHVDPVPLSPDAEPVLFRFVHEICRQVGAPTPSRIQVDCQVNASASFTSLLKSLVQPQFVLTIGLPLGAGLSIREFGGVLAHEFGHFAQGGGMRLTFVVRSINNWFARVVGERDEWDEKLERWSRDGDWRIALVLMLARLSVWCSRRLLYGLMMAGHAISCFMTRQMEYDADSYEVKLVGAGTFTDTFTRLRELNVGAQFGYGDLREGWVHKKLPSNLPAFLLDRCTRIPGAVLDRIREPPKGATGLLDTHPSDADRIAAASLATITPVLAGGDAPATHLFHDFDSLSLSATRHHYEHDLGIDLHGATLVATDAAVRASVHREQSYRAADAFFGQRASMLRAIRVPAASGRAEEHPLTSLIESQLAMSNAGDTIAEQYRAYEALEHKLGLALAAQELLQGLFGKVIAADFGLEEGTLEGARASAAAARAEQQRINPVLSSFEALAGRRLASAIQLLEPSPAAPIVAIAADTRAALRQQALTIVAPLNALADAWPLLNELRHLTTAANLLIGNARNSQDPQLTAKRITDVVDRMRVLLRRIGDAVGTATLLDRDANQLTPLVDVLGVKESTDAEVRAARVLAVTATLRSDLVGELAAIALQVEAAVAPELGKLT